MKLGLMKNFVRAILVSRWEIHRNQCCKNQRGCFYRSTDPLALQSGTVDRIFSGNAKRAWIGFRLVATNFLGYNKAENYKEFVENLLCSYQNLGSNMSVDMHFLHSHVDFSSGKMWVA